MSLDEKMQKEQVLVQPSEFDLIFEDKYGRLLGIKSDKSDIDLALIDIDFSQEIVDPIAEKHWKEAGINFSLSVSKYGGGSGFIISTYSPDFDHICVSHSRGNKCISYGISALELFTFRIDHIAERFKKERGRDPQLLVPSKDEREALRPFEEEADNLVNKDQLLKVFYKIMEEISGPIINIFFSLNKDSREAKRYLTIPNNVGVFDLYEEYCRKQEYFFIHINEELRYQKVNCVALRKTVGEKQSEFNLLYEHPENNQHYWLGRVFHSSNPINPAQAIEVAEKLRIIPVAYVKGIEQERSLRIME